MCVNKLLDNDKTHWQWYKNFFNVTVLRYLVTWFAIVPIAAKLFASFNPHIKFKDYLEIDFLTNASLPSSLQILWLSSLFFVIALLLYQVFCPNFIKTYSSFGDYKHHQHSPRWIIWEAMKVLNDKDEIGKLFERLNEKKMLTELTSEVKTNEVKVETNQTVAYFTHNSKSYSLSLPILNLDKVEEESTKNAEQEIFWEIFGRFSSSKKYWRLTIIVLLIISLILFLITLAEHIWTGLQYFLK